MRRFALVCLLFAACAHSSANQPAPAAQAAPPAPPPPDVTPPALRLSTDVQPTRYAAELTVVPTEQTFKGVATVDLALAHDTQVIWLNANDLTLGTVTATAAGKSYTAQVLPQPKDLVGLQLDRPLPAGPAQLHIEYTGKLYDKEASGLSRQQVGADWYVFTQFEAIDARRAFPCFDEPSFKIPWQLTVDVPAADQAFSNTLVDSTLDAGNGLKRVVFKETKPLPSYLVALAIGPIDVVEAGKTKRGTPVRILVPHGLSAEAKWAASSTPEILSRLEDYFDSDYPFGKLDCVAVPHFGGAMENVGLVTFAQSLILSKPEEESITFRRRYAEVAAHELAHQWFGDLVTTAWWDDLWLNEAFATWMAPKIVEPWQPTWGEGEGRIETRGRAMNADSLLTARKIRQPIQSDDDIDNAFDGITYSKGATVIGMFERWVGPDKFRKGVQRYMHDHANGTATATDFLAAISADAGQDVGKPFSTFLDQAGLPLVTATVDCSAKAAPVLKLTQERYLPQGAAPTADVAQQLWQIPVCARWASGKAEGHACTLLAAQKGTLALDGAKKCPDWVLLNDGGASYYRSLYQGDWASRLFKKAGKQLSASERLSVVSDLSALAKAGKIPYADALALVPKLAADPSRQVVELAANLTNSLSDGQLFPEKLRPRYAAFVRKVFGKRAHALGWKAKKGDSDDTKLLRRALVPLVAREGEDPALQKEARKLAEAWVADHHAVDADLVEVVLETAAGKGDKALFDKWHQAALAEKDVSDRSRLLWALGTFRDPALVKAAMALTLTSEFDSREIFPLLWGPTLEPATRPVAYEFVKANFDGLVAQLPRDSGARFPFFGARTCDEARVDDVKTFFQPREQKITGGPRMLDQALESLQLCVAFKKAQGPSVAKFLSSK